MQINLLRSLTFILIIGNCTFSYSQENTWDFYNFAVERTDNGNYDEAIEYYSRAI